LEGPAPSSLALRATACGGCGLDRAGPSNRRSTIGMKDADLLFPAKSMDCAKFVFIDGLDLQNTGFATLP
jgi:hypothetical protein